MLQSIPSRPASARALLVDDAGVSRLLLGRWLAGHGFEVIDVPSGEAALPLLTQEAFNLVLLDLGLPGISGCELCQTIRDDLALADLPVLALSEHHDLQHIALSRLAGFNEIIFKPLDFNALNRVLAAIPRQA